MTMAGMAAMPSRMRWTTVRFTWGRPGGGCSGRVGCVRQVVQVRVFGFFEVQRGRWRRARRSTGCVGKSIAKALAAAGAFVVVTGRDKVRGDAVGGDIRAAGGEAAFVAGDLGVGQAEVRRVSDAAVESAGGGIDILVNNGGISGMPTPQLKSTRRRCWSRSVPTSSHRSYWLALIGAADGAPRRRCHRQHRGFNGADGSVQRHQGGEPLADQIVGRGVRSPRCAGQCCRARPIATERNTQTTWRRCSQASLHGE